MAVKKKPAPTKAVTKRASRGQENYQTDALLEIEFVGGGAGSNQPLFGGSILQMVGSRPAFATLQAWLDDGWRIKEILATSSPQGNDVHARYGLVWLTFD
jgi:hypothetical protein